MHGVSFGNGLTHSKPELQRTPQPMCPRAIQLYVTEKWSRTPPGEVANQLEFEKHKTESQRGLAASHTVCPSATAFLPQWYGYQCLFCSGRKKKKPQLVQLTALWLRRDPAHSHTCAAHPAIRFWWWELQGSKDSACCSFRGKSEICSSAVFWVNGVHSLLWASWCFHLNYYCSVFLEEEERKREVLTGIFQVVGPIYLFLVVKLTLFSTFLFIPGETNSEHVQNQGNGRGEME